LGKVRFGVRIQEPEFEDQKAGSERSRIAAAREFVGWKLSEVWS